MEVIDSKGLGYVAKATAPEPMADSIEAFYSIPLEAGPFGYVTRHNQRYEF